MGVQIMWSFLCNAYICLPFQAGFPSIDDCAMVAEQFLSEKQIEKAALYYLMSAAPEKGLEIGLKEVKG